MAQVHLLLLLEVNQVALCSILLLITPLVASTIIKMSAPNYTIHASKSPFEVVQ